MRSCFNPQHNNTVADALLASFEASGTNTVEKVVVSNFKINIIKPSLCSFLQLVSVDAFRVFTRVDQSLSSLRFKKETTWTTESPEIRAFLNKVKVERAR